MNKIVKKGALKDVNPDDVVDLVKTAGKIIRDFIAVRRNFTIK